MWHELTFARGAKIKCLPSGGGGGDAITSLRHEKWKVSRTKKLLCEKRTNSDLYSAFTHSTGISSLIRTKLREWAVWQARAGFYSRAAMSSNDSKTLYIYDAN